MICRIIGVLCVLRFELGGLEGKNGLVISLFERLMGGGLCLRLPRWARDNAQEAEAGIPNHNTGEPEVRNIEGGKENGAAFGRSPMLDGLSLVNDQR